jgi:FkbM family methyltransferase
MGNIGALNKNLRWAAQFFPPESSLRRCFARAWSAFLQTTQSPVDVILHGETFTLERQWRSLSADYEKLPIESLLAGLKSTDFFWDIGSHAGIYSLLAASRVEKVLAWEPSPETFRSLQKHILWNGLSGKCEAFNEAVGDREGDRVRFQIDARNPMSPTNLLYDETNPPSGESVFIPMGTIDGWSEKLKRAPSVIKMDIEGNEIRALLGATKTLRGDYGVRPRILLSLHPAAFYRQGYSQDDLKGILTNARYRAEALDSSPPDFLETGEVWLKPS